MRGSIIILARPNDPAAALMAKQWSVKGAGHNDVCVITPWDLSSAGWTYRSENPGASTAVSQGRLLQAEEIGAVVSRLPCVFAEDLGHMEPADRSYAASEMTAFLLAWLYGLRCPVVNRPTPTLLWGPSWRNEKWVRVAHDLGIPVEVARRRTQMPKRQQQSTTKGAVTVTVVGQRCLGDVDKTLARYAASLANAAGLSLLSVRFTGAEKGALFLGASIWPETVTDDVADAVLEHLQGAVS
ncbi:MAG: hypothetical protein OEV28_05180 [Nitrospirota bacterium]|nr:hypothetical protein [Nitrospirota bacterium]